MKSGSFVVFSRRVVLVNESGHVIGEDHHRAKLSNAQVEDLLSMRDQGVKYVDIAKAFGISKTAVAYIVTFRRRAQTAMGQKTLVKKVRV